MNKREEQVLQEAMRQVEARQRRRGGEEALRWIVAWWVLVLLAFFLVPGPLETKLWAAVHGLCAQRSGHMLTFAGQPLPLCARDSGIYLGTLLGTIYLLLRGRWRAAGRPVRAFWRTLLAVLAFFVSDVLNSVAADWFFGGIYPPLNVLRLASGLSLGLAISVPLLWAINLSFAGRQGERSILPHWADLLGLGLVGAAGGLALWSGLPVLYIPLTASAVGGMIGMLLVANALGILTLTRGKALLASTWEAFPPLWWGSVATVVEMAVLSWLRYQIGA